MKIQKIYIDMSSILWYTMIWYVIRYKMMICHINIYIYTSYNLYDMAWNIKRQIDLITWYRQRQPTYSINIRHLHPPVPPESWKLFAVSSLNHGAGRARVGQFPGKLLVSSSHFWYRNYGNYEGNIGIAPGNKHIPRWHLRNIIDSKVPGDIC